MQWLWLVLFLVQAATTGRAFIPQSGRVPWTDVARTMTTSSDGGSTEESTVSGRWKLQELKAQEAELRDSLTRIMGEKAALLKAQPLSIGIVGFGKFGQFLARRFLQQGHQVSALSRSNWSPEAQSMGVNYYEGLGHIDDDGQPAPDVEAFLSQADLDVIIFAVSILSFEETVAQLPLHLLEGSGVLFVDVLSVKLHPRAVLERAAPAGCDVVCTHPMFGPESGSRGWGGLPFVYEKVRVLNPDRVERFLSIFETEGCEMVEMDSDDHDENAANSQFATHLVGRLLEQLDLAPTPIDTRGFQTMLALKDTVAGDSFDLFYGLYKYNPNSVETLLLLRKALVDLEWRLKEMESEDAGTPGWKIPAWKKRVEEMTKSQLRELRSVMNETDLAR